MEPSGGPAPFGTIYTTAIGYPPKASSTSHCFLDGWIAMNYKALQHVHLYYECEGISLYFSILTGITTLDPAWSA